MGFAQYLAGAPVSVVSDAVEKTDNSLAMARKRAELRARAERLSNQINNLKKQREAAVINATNLKKQREALTDDEIVRMAKVKGIKDEDINAYINGRITQRNADISNNQTKAIKEQAEAEAASAKAKELEASENMLFDLEQKITDNSIKLSTGNKMEKKSALATSRTLNNQYEKAIAKYKELTGKEWESNVEEIDPEEPIEEGERPEEKPEGFDDWTEVEKAEYNSYGADEDKKNALVAKKKVEKAANDKSEKQRLERIQDNSNKGKSATRFSDAKYYANKVAKDSKPKKTYTQILEEWGWNVANQTKAGE